MKLEKTERNTLKIGWHKGELEVNLVPVNPILSSSSNIYKSRSSNVSFERQLLSINDCVGIVALKLKDCPAVPRICWDNREHHFWRGFCGGFEPRNTIVNNVEIFLSEDKSSVVVSFYYIVNFVKTTVKWVFKEPAGDNSAEWDAFFTFENFHNYTLKDYMALFACYHKPGKNYYWDDQNSISECCDLFRAHENETKIYVEFECTRDFREKIKGWHGIKDAVSKSVIYGKPVLLSGRQEWFDKGRHIILIEPEKCMSIVSAANQARDYMLAPPTADLAPKQSFSAGVRHIIAKIETMDELRNEWERFEKDSQAKT